MLFSLTCFSSLDMILSFVCQGNLSPMSSSPSILGSNLVFNTSRNHQGESGGSSGQQMHLIYNTPPSSNLPSRPDQPECRHFMNTGTCKYGSDCKYHHPKDRTAQLATNPGPIGLPSRPGQALCSNYITYGFCKFGSNCRFDHPFTTGYPYSYSLTVPPFTVLDSSMVTYPRMSPSEPPSLSPSPNKVLNSNGAARNNKQQYQMNAGNNKNTMTTTTPTTPPSDDTTDVAGGTSPPLHSSSKASSEVSHD
ncbi:unnamed protein product [Linum tenue]|uniref:C3H1-type domain-containing protein n=1 Tax=Linum tenue TaxID=586396 RepID=A0AAV0R328_9ROSI|nr:unnamed protein product [Linum tenue]